MNSTGMEGRITIPCRRDNITFSVHCPLRLLTAAGVAALAAICGVELRPTVFGQGVNERRVVKPWPKHKCKRG